MTLQYVLHVNRTQSPRISGRLFCGEIEICGVAGCASAEEVKRAVIDLGHQVDFIVDAETGEAL